MKARCTVFRSAVDLGVTITVMMSNFKANWLLLFFYASLSVQPFCSIRISWWVIRSQSEHSETASFFWLRYWHCFSVAANFCNISRKHSIAFHGWVIQLQIPERQRAPSFALLTAVCVFSCIVCLGIILKTGWAVCSVLCFIRKVFLQCSGCHHTCKLQFRATKILLYSKKCYKTATSKGSFADSKAFVSTSVCF